MLSTNHCPLKYSRRGGCYIKASGKTRSAPKKKKKIESKLLNDVVLSALYSTVLHTHTDSNGVVREQRETISSLSVIKQWRHPPRWPGQRGIEWLRKDLCFTMAVINNVIRHGLCVSVGVFLYYGGMWKAQKQRQRQDSTITQLRGRERISAFLFRGKHLSRVIIPITQSEWSVNMWASNRPSPLEHMIVYWSATTAQQSPWDLFVILP